MIQSMTATAKKLFGAIENHYRRNQIAKQQRLDLNTRVPSAYREKELEIRDLLAKSLQRGKWIFASLKLRAKKLHPA